MATEEERPIFLSTMPAEPRERRLALAVVVASLAVFAAAAPFARERLAAAWAFLPVYQSALVVNDLITTVLLLGQFAILRLRALLLLGAAYFLSALMAVAHALSFPGLFAETGLLGSGPQTTAWLYFLWHAGFPLLVIAYARTKGAPLRARGAALPVLATLLAVALAAGALTLLATSGQSLLPVIMDGNRDAPAKLGVATACWMLSVVAIAALWRRRPLTVLDLWLMVVMCAWVFDVALASVLNAGRFDVGWYAGRAYGLLASSFVLIVLLLENGVLYARLAEAHAGERRARRRVEEKTTELVIANKELDAFSHSVSHDLRAPLRTVDGYARMLEEDYAARLDAEARRLIGVLRVASQRMGRMIEDLLEFSKLGRHPLRTQPVQMNDLVASIVAELRPGAAGREIDFAIGELGVAQADPSLLRHALTNLIANAIKYTRKRDHATVEIGRTGTPEGPVYFVKDNGAGFDPRYADKLFGVFQRLHGADEFEGTGVGLSIVRRIAERHGGRIWAEGRPGEGATFYFTLNAGAEAPAPITT
ncbi:MAG TPA: MASE4 domain-containing protein [Burkholderiales bacterium]|nr:MASE4 domain-containing protein [Burkholderiales bacterium]